MGQGEWKSHLKLIVVRLVVALKGDHHLALLLEHCTQTFFVGLNIGLNNL